MKFQFNKVNFSITDDGNIEAESKYTSEQEKEQIEQTMSTVLNRWQMETLKIVVQLLGYSANIASQTIDGKETLTLVAEEKGKTHPCKYIRISKDADDKGEVVFEHFADKSELEVEKNKFAALAQKLGVKISLPDSEVKGSLITTSTEEKEKGKT